LVDSTYGTPYLNRDNALKLRGLLMSENPELRLESLIGALKWDADCVSLAVIWRGMYIALLQERFEAVVESDSSGLLGAVRQAMSLAEVENLLFSPRVSWRLLRDPDLDCANAIRMEMLRALDAISVDDNGHEISVEGGCLQLTEMTVDLRSPYDCPSREPGEPALAHLRPEVEAPSLALFESAVKLLKRRAPDVRDFVHQMTTRVVFRSDLRRPSSFASGTFRGHAGMTLIVNPQVIAGSTLRLVDALVHESVHTAIEMFEQVDAHLCRPAPSELRLRSCWSGRDLTLDQFVQACFVWWGLLNLWRLWPAEGPEERRAAKELLERAACGFRARPVSMLRTSINDNYLDTRTWAALFEIEREAMIAASVQ
jgi:hypothetical protein